MTRHVRAARETLVFDVLGTLVDQRGSLFEQMTSAISADEDATNLALSSWLAYVEAQQAQIGVTSWRVTSWIEKRSTNWPAPGPSSRGEARQMSLRRR